MSAPRKRHHVSLRGASAKEITREVLLEKVLHERELRNYIRSAEAAALFIQRYVRVKRRTSLRQGVGDSSPDAASSLHRPLH